MTQTRPIRTVLVAFMVTAAIALVGCASSGESGSAGATGTTPSGSSTATGTTCDLSGCTVVLQRGVDARTSVLGIEIELVGVTGSQVSLKVAGQQVSVPLDPNGSASVAGFGVSVQSADADRIVLKVTRG